MTISQAFDLALQHHQAGRLAEAEALYRQILAAQPGHSDALHLLGVIAHQGGRHDLAVDLIRQAIALDPNNSFAHSNLGEAYRATGSFHEAIAAYRMALKLKPNYAEAYNNLGAALKSIGQLGEAIANFQRTLALKPDFPEAWSNLGDALREQGRLDEAIAACRRALQVRPDFPEAYNNLGAALAGQKHFDEALVAYRRAIELKADYAEAHNNTGAALGAQGQLDEAVAAYRRALHWKPDYSAAHSSLIFALHFHPDHDSRTISAERQRWAQRFSDPLRQSVLPHTNDRDPARRLRVGYVSPDFREHVVGRNLRPLFEFHDRGSFEIFCYSGVIQPDRMTEEFRARAKLWRNTVGMSDEALAETIRADGVDILVDLSQHMAGNRLPVFARKPAPIQVSFAGYPESTGLEAIEYRISDPYLEPHSAHEEAGEKERLCLIDSFWCYDPCGVDAQVNALPARGAGNVTFGCLNNLCKVNGPVLSLWARVLEKAANSRLILLAGPGSHRERTLEALASEGVKASRVEFVELRPRREYLEFYHRLDIVLDSFPYNGHTTSLDALWMGVPVVTLAGKTAVSRAGLSQLTHLGLPELAAHTEAEYVRIAERLACDLPRLAHLRATLRVRMQNSVLMDAPRFARNIEAAYRSMWQGL